jgi:hypothetical protein
MPETQKPILTIIDLNGTADQMWRFDEVTGRFYPDCPLGDFLREAVKRHSNMRFGMITGGVVPTPMENFFRSYPEIDFVMQMPMLGETDFVPNAEAGVTHQSTRDFLRNASLIIINNDPDAAVNKRKSIGFFARPQRRDLLGNAPVPFIHYGREIETQGLLRVLNEKVQEIRGTSGPDEPGL